MSTASLLPAVSRPSYRQTFSSIRLHGRLFSTTSSLAARRRRITRQRLRMLQWLRGPGSVFRIPRRGSTNYLAAYDKEGNLIRENEEAIKARQQEKKARGEEDADDDIPKDEAEKFAEEREEAEDGELAQQGQGRGSRDKKRIKKELEKERREKKKSTPPETVEDLQPFPLNAFFTSPPVLSLELRQEICHRVVTQGQTVREVSQALGVDMIRIGAVVRLKALEQKWMREDKPLALDYRAKILAMLPHTPYNPNKQKNPPHESINDLPIHPATLPQLFHPAAESAQFTRADAGRVFHRGLLPADQRIPHPDMVETAREERAGMKAGERARLRRERWEKEEEEIKAKEEERRRKKEQRETIVQGKRWDFRFEQVQSDRTGGLGRDTRGVGWRYGMPLEDRKRGHVKIPVAVE